MSDAALQTAAHAPDYAPVLQRLRGAFAGDRTRSLDWRRTQLHSMQRMLTECEAEIFAVLEADLGKHPMESFATEVGFVAAETAHYRRNLARWSRKRRIHTPIVGQPGRSWIKPEPLGVVLVIGAWNYPLQLTLAGAAAAIAAGNCVVMKPSELAPATSALIARLIPQYLDPDCFAVVEGGVTETTALLEQRFDHILYTGGGNVGRIVMAAAAKYLTPVTLELGGKSPCIVLPDADLDATARRIAWGKYVNAGQTCIAPDYVLTDAATEETLVPLLKKHIDAMYGNDPSQSESYGKIINARHHARVSALIDATKVAVGGDSNTDSLYIAPTVMTGVTADDAVMQQEIFGPILPILRSESLYESIAFVRKGEKPLSAYLFTNDKSAQARFLDQVSCGSACINDVLMFMAVPELPFGGVGESGMGAYTGQRGFDTFSHLKAVMKRGWWPDLDVRYAPYTNKKFAFLRKLT